MRRWAVLSKSQKGEKYEIKEIENGYVPVGGIVKEIPEGLLICDCPGFTFRGHCWHVELIRKFIDSGIEYLGDF